MSAAYKRITEASLGDNVAMDMVRSEVAPYWSHFIIELSSISMLSTINSMLSSSNNRRFRIANIALAHWVKEGSIFILFA